MSKASLQINKAINQKVNRRILEKVLLGNTYTKVTK